VSCLELCCFVRTNYSCVLPLVGFSEGFSIPLSFAKVGVPILSMLGPCSKPFFGLLRLKRPSAGLEKPWVFFFFRPLFSPPRCGLLKGVGAHGSSGFQTKVAWSHVHPLPTAGLLAGYEQIVFFRARWYFLLCAAGHPSKECPIEASALPLADCLFFF